MQPVDTDNITSDCNTTGLSYKQKDQVLIIMATVGSVSFCACLITISIVICLKLYTRFVYRLAMYQVIASLLVSMDNIMVITLTSYVSEYGTFQHVMCLLTGVMKTYFVWINLLFTVTLTLHFFLMAVCLVDIKRFEVGYVVFAIIFPLLFVWVPFINDNYGQVGAFCWIRSRREEDTGEDRLEREGLIEQYSLLYGPCYLFLFICILLGLAVMAVLVNKRCSQRKREYEHLDSQENKKYKKALIELIPLLAYPAIFFCFNLFVIGRRVYDYTDPCPNFQLSLAHAFIMTSWGILSSIALVVHVLINRYVLPAVKRGQHNSQGNTVPPTQTGVNRTALYTSYATVSTTANTHYSVPEESMINEQN